MEKDKSTNVIDLSQPMVDSIPPQVLKDAGITDEAWQEFAIAFNKSLSKWDDEKSRSSVAWTLLSISLPIVLGAVAMSLLPVRSIRLSSFSEILGAYSLRDLILLT